MGRKRRKRRNPRKKLPSDAICVEPAGHLSSLRYETWKDVAGNYYQVEPLRCHQCKRRVVGVYGVAGNEVRCMNCNAMQVVPKNKDRVVVSRKRKRRKKRRRNPLQRRKLQRCKGQTIYGKRCRRYLRSRKCCRCHRRRYRRRAR